MRKGLSFVSVIALCLAALFASAAGAAEKRISIEYVGTGFNTGVDVAGDGIPVSLTFATGKGTFGASDFKITTDFTPAEVNDCPAGFDQKVDLVYSSAVITFPDQNQLYAIAFDGYLCASSAFGTYRGEVYGLYVGGTGRFEGASGTFMTPFEGVYLDPAIGFRSFQGSVTGSVEVP